MPSAANFTVISDAWSAAPRFDFQVPESIDPSSMPVLGFMLDPDVGAEAEVRLLLNGEPVWRWRFGPQDTGAARFFQEVIPAGVAKPGANRLEWDSSNRSAGRILTSDIVLWWHASF
jgi:hypothetical protein